MNQLNFEKVDPRCWEAFLPAAKRHGHREGGILVLVVVVVVLGTFSFSSFPNS